MQVVQPIDSAIPYDGPIKIVIKKARGGGFFYEWFMPLMKFQKEMALMPEFASRFRDKNYRDEPSFGSLGFYPSVCRSIASARRAFPHQTGERPTHCIEIHKNARAQLSFELSTESI